MEPKNLENEPNIAVKNPETGEDCVVKKRTTGNKLFDWLAYGTVSYAGVSAMSLATVHEAHHGSNRRFDWLRNMNTKFTEALEKNVFSKIFKNNPEKVKAWSAGTAMFWMLGFGGTALSPILKYMEDNRLKLSAKIDNALGTTPPDPELIAREPKQSWLSVMSGRFASVAFGYVSFVAMGPKVASNVSKWLGEHATNITMKLKPSASPKAVRNIADIAVFDLFFTAVTASVTYVISRFVAKKTDNIPDIECEPEKSQPKPVIKTDKSAPQESERQWSDKALESKRKPLAKHENFASHVASASHATEMAL